MQWIFYPEDDPHPHYIVACDVSGYTDFSENFSQNANYKNRGSLHEVIGNLHWDTVSFII